MKLSLEKRMLKASIHTHTQYLEKNKFNRPDDHSSLAVSCLVRITD